MEKIVNLFGEKVKGKDGDVQTSQLCGEKKLIGMCAYVNSADSAF
jgi:hypothetical protein